MSLIHVENLTKRYNEGEVLNGMNFFIKKEA